MFEFEIGQPVLITVSKETGNVIARAEFETCEQQYLVRYKSGEGCAVEQWWTESALSHVIPKPVNPKWC